MIEIFTSIFNWIIFESFIGVLAISTIAFLVSFFLSTAIKLIIPKFPKPIIISTVVFLISSVTVPSIPRYQFEKKTLSFIEGKPWIKVIDKAYWGSIIEPLTLFKTPLGSIYLIMPGHPYEFGPNSYYEVLLQYKKDPKERIAETNCSERTIRYAEPDKNFYRYSSIEYRPMNEEEIKIYCEDDWTKEKKALRADILRHLDSN